MVTAEANVVLFQLNGPEGGVELAVLVLPVGVHASDEAQQHQHHQYDDGQDDDVELRPGDFRKGRRGVVSGAAQAGQQCLGGGGGAQRGARVAAGRGSWDASRCGGDQSGAGGGGRGRGRCAGFRCGCCCWCGKEPGCWTGAVMCSGVPYEAWSTELALEAGGVVDAAEAVAGVGVTELGGVLRVCIAIAVTRNTSPRCFVEAGATLVTLRAAVPGKALVTYGGATGIGVAGAVGGGVGAGTRCTGFGPGGSRSAVGTGLTLLTVGSMGVALTVQTHSGLWMAVVGVVVTLAGPAASAAEVEETRVAFITLWSVHSRLAHTYP